MQLNHFVMEGSPYNIISSDSYQEDASYLISVPVSFTEGKVCKCEFNAIPMLIAVNGNFVLTYSTTIQNQLLTVTSTDWNFVNNGTPRYSDYAQGFYYYRRNNANKYLMYVFGGMRGHCIFVNGLRLFNGYDNGYTGSANEAEIIAYLKSQSNGDLKITLISEGRTVIYRYFSASTTSINALAFYENLFDGYGNPSYYSDVLQPPVKMFCDLTILDEYAITLLTPGGNGVISGASSASSGDTVTLTVTPDTGYVLSSLAVYKTSSQDPVSYTKVNDTTYTFVMPDTNVTVTGIFARAYSVTGNVSPTGTGSVTVTSPQMAGRNVDFSLVTNTGYFVNMVRVYGLDNSREFNWNEDTLQGSFVMPARNVDIVAYLSKREDQNEQGGTSQPSEDGGEFDDTSDNILIPSTPVTDISYDVPIGSGNGKGILTIFNPNLTELKDLGDYLYANSVTEQIWNGLRNIFANPMDAIISLHVIPFTPSVGVNKHHISLGALDTMIYANLVKSQYQNVDLGSLEIKPYWNSYLDYSPYTKISLYLPYIGSVELNPDIVMGKTVGINYRCDVLTGGCVAYLYTWDGEPGFEIRNVFGEYSGSMALSLPLSGSDFSQIISGFISAVSSVAIMKATGGASLVTNAAEGVSEATANVHAAKSAISDAYAMPRQLHVKGVRGSVSNVAARNEAIEKANDAYSQARETLAMARGRQQGLSAIGAATRMATVPYTVGRVMGSKVNTTISGTITGGLGLLGSQTPYVLITRPRQSLAEDYKHFVGYPCNMSAQLSTLSGFTKVEQVLLENVPCTDEELAMLYTALKEGVYI